MQKIIDYYNSFPELAKQIWNPSHLRIFRCYDSPQWSYVEKDSVAMANNGLKIVLFFTLCPNHCCVRTMLLPNLNCLNNSFYSYGVSSPFGVEQLKQQPCMEQTKTYRLISDIWSKELRTFLHFKLFGLQPRGVICMECIAWQKQKIWSNMRH